MSRIGTLTGVLAFLVIAMTEVTSAQAPGPGAAPALRPSPVVEAPSTKGNAAHAAAGSDSTGAEEAKTSSEASATAAEPQPIVSAEVPLPEAPVPSAAPGSTSGEGAAPRLTQSSPRNDLPHDLSPLGMFMAADIVVKAVMLGLLLASVATWAVWLAKVTGIGWGRRTVAADLKALKNDASLMAAYVRLQNRTGIVPELVRDAVAESRASSGLLNSDGLKERVASRLDEVETLAIRHARGGTGLLASVGATSPFIGLFGTVWGIMNSFIGISKAQTTNLAVVAPGIAEALLATAIGLVAAIPAVLFYNQINRSIGAYRSLVRQSAAEVQRHLSRDVDRTGDAASAQRVKLAAE